MKVVFAHTDFRIYWPARLRALNDFLNGQGIDFEIIEIAGEGSHYSFAGYTGSHPVNWHILFPDRKIENISPAEANKELRKKLDEIRPDIVFAGAIAFPSGAAAVRWADENRRKVIIFDNARLEDVPRPWSVNFIKKKIYSRVDAVFCPAPAWNSTFNYFGFRNNQIFYGLNVTDNNFWQGQVTGGADGLPKDYMLSVGRQVQKKNILFLLKAYSEYVKSTPFPKDLILVGDGPKRKILEDFVKDSALEKVHFVSFATQEHLRTLYRNASFFILPSRFGETWGLSVNEAMASALPVLVSNQSGCASTLVSEDRNGFTFSPDNLEELCFLLLRMHEMPASERKKMGKESLSIISNWGLERFCNGVHGAISWVSGNKKRRADLFTSSILKYWKGRYRPT